MAAGLGVGIASAVSNLAGEIASPIIQGEYNATQAQLQREHEKSENQIARNFNKEEAVKDRNFQREMRDTSFISAVNQAKKLGISPSLLLGDQSNQLGGSRASASSVSSSSKASLSGVNNPLSGIVEILNKSMENAHQRELQEDKQEHQRELQEEKLEHLKNLQILKNNLKMSNSSTSKEAQKHDYTKKEYDNMYTDISKIEI